MQSKLGVGLYLILIPFLLLLSLGACASDDATYRIDSPDESIEVQFWVGDGNQALYRVRRSGSVVLDTSRLGLRRTDADFSGGLSLTSAEVVRSVDDRYEMLHGKQKERTYSANERVFHLENRSGEPLDIIFRVSDDGVAFRYHFPNRDEETWTITEEATTYHFPDDSRAWLQPLANVNTGFAGTNPSYEEYYVKGIDVGTPAPDSAGWAYPALFESGDSWVLVTETGLRRNYAGTRLQQEAPGGEYHVGFPQAQERIPGEALHPTSTLPWSTPWRVLAIGSLETIVESTLGTDLANPAVDMELSWVEPGRASWSWAKLKDASVNYETQKRFVDYAADMGWEYTLVDVNWDTTIGYKRIAELADYAATKGVGLLLWYNSSGSWNETEYHPKGKLLTHEDRVDEFSRLREIGIKGIKVDFFGGDGQSMIAYYKDIFEDAAAYELLVNCHGSTIPRGWHRTYPNLMTMEAVRGFEFITFEQANADRAASHSAMLPFTRNVFDPMDFTPMSLTEIPNIERKTTNGFELALPILFTSGIQHYAETPRGMAQVPPYVREFIRQIPVDWDETEFIDGFPGELMVMARRAGDRWFVAGINGEEKAKEVEVDLSFLPAGAEGTLITDGASRFAFSQRRVARPADGTVDVSLRANGGFVAHFETPR